MRTSTTFRSVPWPWAPTCPRSSRASTCSCSSAAASCFDAQGGLAIESEEAEDVLAFLAKGLASGFLTSVSDYYGPSMQAALKSGKLAGLWMASWYKTFGLLPNVPDQKGLWRIRPLPRFSGGGSRAAFAGGTGFAVLKDKPNTDAATHLLAAAYLDPQEQIRRYQMLGYLPTLRSVFDDPALLSITDEFCGGQRLFDVYSRRHRRSAGPEPEPQQGHP